MAASVYSRTLQKAAELVGGRVKLCRELRVPGDELQKWIDDKAVPPIAVFLKAVDIVIAESPSPAADSQAGEPPAPRDCAPGDSQASQY